MTLSMVVGFMEGSHMEKLVYAEIMSSISHMSNLRCQ